MAYKIQSMLLMLNPLGLKKDVLTLRKLNLCARSKTIENNEKRACIGLQL